MPRGRQTEAAREVSTVCTNVLQADTGGPLRAMDRLRAHHVVQFHFASLGIAMRRNVSSLLVAIALAAAAPLGAQVSVTFVAPHAPGGGTVASFGVYMSPYTGTVNGQTVTLNCDDFFHEVANGDTWMANKTSLGGGSLANTRFGGLTNALTLYREAAWLTTQYDFPNPAADPGETVAIQTAIWNLFGAGAPSMSGQTDPDDNTAFWLGQAATRYTTIADYSSFYVLTDVNANTRFDATSMQEFIVTTPEPATLVLLAPGLAGLAVFVRRRKSSGRALPM